MNPEVSRRIAPILESSVAPSVTCFNPDGFQYFLTRELAESKRYGQFSGYLLFRVEAGDEPDRLARLVRYLGESIRDTDVIGLVNERTVGVILQHATVENTTCVMQRLKRELDTVFAAPHSHVGTSSAVFPTEANTLDSLCTLAEHRLAQTVS